MHKDGILFCAPRERKSVHLSHLPAGGFLNTVLQAPLKMQLACARGARGFHEITQQRALPQAEPFHAHLTSVWSGFTIIIF